MISTFDKHDKMQPFFHQMNKTQLLAKFEKTLYLGFRATLNFRKFFKVALNPMYRIFLNFAKSSGLSCLLKFDNLKIFHCADFNYEPLKP